MSKDLSCMLWCCFVTFHTESEIGSDAAMESKKGKPLATKPRAIRSASDSSAKLSSPGGVSKPPKVASNHQQASTLNSRKSVVATTQKRVSHPNSGAAATAKEQEQAVSDNGRTFPNSPFTVLVHVLVAATKWRKVLKDATPKRSVTKTLSLPPPALRPV